MAKMKQTIAYVYKWTHLPTLKWYIGSKTAKGCHPDDGYRGSSKHVTPLINANPAEWSKEIIDTGTPQDMYDLETEILQLFDAKNDPRSFNRHNNTGLVRGLPGDKNPAWGKKRPDLSKRNIDSKGIPKPANRGPKPFQRGKNNAMNKPGVREHHQQQVFAAMQSEEVKKKHSEGCKIAQNIPAVKEAKSERMKIYCARPEVKAAKSKRVSGDNNPSKKYVLTCPNCNRSMAIGMFVRWGHGTQCQK